jgi:hypothetical protein
MRARRARSSAERISGVSFGRKLLAMVQRRDGRRVVRVVAFAIGCMSNASIAPQVHMVLR